METSIDGCWGFKIAKVSVGQYPSAVIPMIVNRSEWTLYYVSALAVAFKFVKCPFELALPTYYIRYHIFTHLKRKVTKSGEWPKNLKCTNLRQNR